MHYLLEKTIANERFTEQEAKQFIHAIDAEELSNESIAGILVGIQQRGVELNELRGFRAALLELSTPIQLDSEQAIDLCGTGGDGKDTFNISTTSAFVLAAMGKKVIKHGNYGVSSMCGSSNVLEELGIQFTSNPDVLQRQLDEKNICFLHAPLFHPTMKKVAPIRKGLGIRTVFNCLGPLVNPAQPNYQMTGTYGLDIAKVYQHILKDERTDFRVLYGMDGYDEITLTDNTRVLGKHLDGIVNHETFDTKALIPESLYAGHSKQDAAIILSNVLNGIGTVAQTSVVAVNVATALQMYEPMVSLKDHYHNALDFIRSGKSYQLLNLN